MLQKICSKQIFASLQVPFHYLERQQQQARLLDQEHYNPKLKKTWKLSNSIVDQPENSLLLQILSVFFSLAIKYVPSGFWTATSSSTLLLQEE